MFPKKSGSVTQLHKCLLTPCQNLEICKDPLSRNHLDRRMDKWKDGLKDEQALFYRTVPATTWVQKVQKKKKGSLKIFLEKQMLLIKREKVISQKEV